MAHELDAIALPMKKKILWLGLVGNVYTMPARGNWNWNPQHPGAVTPICHPNDVETRSRDKRTPSI